jgi:ABC-type antimicrobial peptide transport system permease subunit
MVFARLGNTQLVLSSFENPFRFQIARELSNRIGIEVVPMLITQGMAIVDGGAKRVNNVQILGINESFNQLDPSGRLYKNFSENEIIINEALARQLNINPGDDILVRFKKPDIIPLDSSLSINKKRTIARPFTIRAVAGRKDLGRFNLKSNQVVPKSIFISISSLSKILEIEGKANLLLFPGNNAALLDKGKIMEALKACWQPVDASFSLDSLADNKTVELRTKKIFIDPHIEEVALKINPQVEKILTYFVNGITLGKITTPYSFISATNSSLIPEGTKADEIIINEWLAKDLKAKIGDQVDISYFTLGKKNNLLEKTIRLRISNRVPMSPPYIDKGLMPQIPGITEVKSCREWNPDIPIHFDKIRKKDETYWLDYQGTPKAFITLPLAQNLWKNKFGNTTALRFRGLSKDEIASEIMKNLDPLLLGYSFLAVKEEGLAASQQSVDFGMLFLGLSFFIIVGALLLTGLLFVIKIKERSQEYGLFSAVGFPQKKIRKIMLMEEGFLILFGSLVGSFVGMLYTHIILHALTTVWQGAVGTSALRIHLIPSTLAMGIAANSIFALLTIYFMQKIVFKELIMGLQRGILKYSFKKNSKAVLSRIIIFGSTICLVIIIWFTGGGKAIQNFGFFFLAGSLMLITGLAIFNLFFYKVKNQTRKSTVPNIFSIGIKNMAMKSFNSLTLAALLACGLFIVFTVGANKKNALVNSQSRSSGTGGFALYAESSIPIYHDLNSNTGRDFHRLAGLDKTGITFVNFNYKEGDDASCLNLNRVSKPSIIGVDPEELAQRSSFTFVTRLKNMEVDYDWSCLNLKLSDGSIPAVADQSVITWGLGKKIGDELVYLDDNGQEFKIKLVGGLANSVFQGKIIISNRIFAEKFPSLKGYQVFLIDIPKGKTEEVSESLSRSMVDFGLEVLPAYEKLATFNQVENTYLSIFLLLGSFGLVLGSIGIGITLWNNMAGRQFEFALLRAIGFNKKKIGQMVFWEHFLVFMTGTVIGLLSAIVGSLPTLMNDGSQIPYALMTILLVIIIINGFIWTYLSVRLNLKEEIIPVLRND